MALHIRDPEAEELVRDLARIQNVSLTEAIREACREKLLQEQRKIPIQERLAKAYALVDAMPDSGEKADKAFFDDLWGEAE